MTVLLILIAISTVAACLWFLAFVWAVNSGQFSDLDSPAQDIFLDD